MALFDTFPNTKYHEINLDWILDTLKELTTAIETLQESSSSSLTDRMDTAETNIETLQTEVEAADTGLLARMDTAENDIDALETAAEKIPEVVYCNNFTTYQEFEDAIAAGKVMLYSYDDMVYYFGRRYYNTGINYAYYFLCCDVDLDFGVMHYIVITLTLANVLTWSAEDIDFPTNIEVITEVRDNSNNPVTSAAIYAALAQKADSVTVDAEPTANSDNPVASGGVYDALESKQDTLTFDSTPTDGSTNPVTSEGIRQAILDAEMGDLTIDAEPSANSDNPVASGGVYDALELKQDTLTFDSTPTSSSNNPVTSDGIYQAIINEFMRGSVLMADASGYSLAADSSIIFDEDLDGVYSGYSPLFIGGFTITGTNSDHLIVNRMYVSGTVAYVRVYNPSSAAITISALRIYPILQKD